MFRRETTETITERLKKRVDANAAYRERLQKMGAEYRERMAIIASSPVRNRMGFYCEQCRKDFDAVGYKHSNTTILNVDTGMSEPRFPSVPHAWYTALCPKRHEAVRHITDKQRDVYFNLSLVVRQDRARYERDLLQPSDPRFKLVYPEQWKKLQEQRDAQEQILNGERATV